MRTRKDRLVYRSGAGWANERQGAERAEGIYPTQQDAIKAARENLRRAGGGELTIQGRDGRFRDKNTIAPGNDPFPPRDKR
jgi:hypothetical protein